ncbi:uncharacterized, partial [Tachysurus ichikawai]
MIAALLAILRAFCFQEVEAKGEYR